MSGDAPARLRLLVGADAFWEALSTDIAGAQERVLVQTLSFEGDAAGLGLTDALLASPAPDRRALVDRYTRWIQSDRFIYSPSSLLDPELRAEVRRTWGMIEDLRAGGVGVRWVNPAGVLFRRGAFRNHKKLMAVDGRVAYLGGINFSAHNFAWHDMMLRVEDPEVAAMVRADMEATWAGKDVPATRTFPGLRLILLDGRENRTLFQPVLDAMAEAREEILVHSPYLTFPFVEALAEARRRGVRVRLLSPAGNNHGFLRRYVTAAAHDHGFEIGYLPGMSHLKAMRIDHDVLIMGSSNFDYLSYSCQQDVVAVVRDPSVVADFDARVLEPDLARSRPPAAEPGTWTPREDRWMRRMFEGLVRVGR
jgi:cardiolipin synthase A/B